VSAASSQSSSVSPVANKLPSQLVQWPASSQVLSTFAREGFGACCRGTSRGSNPYAVGARDQRRHDLAQQEWEMAEEWWHGWDEAHIDR
jgi:hypothetical protein